MGAFTNLTPEQVQNLIKELTAASIGSTTVSSTPTEAELRPIPIEIGSFVKIGRRGRAVYKVLISFWDTNTWLYTIKQVVLPEVDGGLVVELPYERRNMRHEQLRILTADQLNEMMLTNGKARREAKRVAQTELFNSVIISKYKRAQIEQAINQINNHDLIFKQWGFEDTIEKGRGVAMLFYGQPGTGKTLMAEAIARMLEKPLKTVSNADIQSSAPGEAERNIRAAFAEAKDKDLILLFDECDSLIFTRKAAGPILAAQINELLSQIERFDGITLFTTNRLGQLDEAVNRRLALKLEFNMPTHNERVKIWQRMIPKKAPLHEDVDLERLAEVEVTGGYIKNAVLRAARIASSQDMKDSDKKITMEHFIDALIQEVESLEEFEEAAQEDSYIPINGALHRASSTKVGITRQT